MAVGMCPAALGSQTVGSVLRPASYNGVVGLKPTYGRVSRHGVVPVSWSLDTVGWMARSVEDAALLLQVMAGPDPNDPVAARFPAGDYLSGLESDTPPRISLIRPFFMEGSDAEVQSNVSSALNALASAGASIDEVVLPESFNTAIQDQQIIMACEAAAFHQPMYETRSEEYRPLLRAMLRRGLDTDAATYSQALERRLRFITDMHLLAEQADVLLTPSTPTPALADLTNTGNAMFQGPWTLPDCPPSPYPPGWRSPDCPWVSRSSRRPSGRNGSSPPRDGARECWTFIVAAGLNSCRSKLMNAGCGSESNPIPHFPSRLPLGAYNTTGRLWVRPRPAAAWRIMSECSHPFHEARYDRQTHRFPFLRAGGAIPRTPAQEQYAELHLPRPPWPSDGPH